MRECKSNRIALILFFLCFIVWVSAGYSGTIERKRKLKGCYSEEGKYSRTVVIDTIEESPETAKPELSDNIKKRKKEISRFFKGKVVTAKVSLPACYGGLVLYNDDLGKSNVEVFKRADKYGVVAAKGDKVIITKFRIKKRMIDVELNSGGYGDFGDLFLRSTAGIFSLGITELSGCFSKIRYERGSRLRVKFKSKLGKEELDLEKIKGYLSSVLEINY
jgi:hypothetical protein